MEGFAEGMGCMATATLAMIPLSLLGVWKLIELIIVLLHHLRWV